MLISRLFRLQVCFFVAFHPFLCRYPPVLHLDVFTGQLAFPIHVHSASTCAVPGSSDCILRKVAWESVKTVTLLTSLFLVIWVAIFTASDLAYIFASNASFCWPRCTLPLLHLSSFHTTAHPTHSSSFLDPSVQRSRPFLSFLAFTIACSLCWIITFAFNTFLSVSNVVLSYCLLSRNSSRINSSIPSTLCTTFPSILIILPLPVASGSIICLVLYRLTRLLRIAVAAPWPASFIKAPWVVILKHPVTLLPCSFNISCTSCALFFCPFHYSSAPYNATACTAATWIRWHPSELNPFVVIKDRTLFWAPLAFAKIFFVWSFRVSILSSHTPSHLVASLLYWTSLLPTRILALIFGSLLLFLGVNNIASGFSTPTWQAFSFAHFCASFTHPSNRCVHSPKSPPSTTHPTSLTNDMPSLPHSSSFSSTLPNNHERYLTKSTSNTGDPCGTPISTSKLSPSFLSIDIITLLSFIKLDTHLTRLASNTIFFILFIKFPFATCGKAFLISINSTATVFPLPHTTSTLFINLPTASVADYLVLHPNCPSWSSCLRSHSSAIAFATTFWTTFPRQFNNVITLYALATP